jgi:hypothetical protein
MQQKAITNKIVEFKCGFHKPIKQEMGAEVDLVTESNLNVENMSQSEALVRVLYAFV